MAKLPHQLREILEGETALLHQAILHQRVQLEPAPRNAERRQRSSRAAPRLGAVS